MTKSYTLYILAMRQLDTNSDVSIRKTNCEAIKVPHIYSQSDEVQ